MIEQGPRVGKEKTVDEAFSRLWQLIQPALTGYRPRLEILSKKKDSEVWVLAGRETPSEIAEGAMEKLKEELGFRPEESYEAGSEERIGSVHCSGVPRYFPTELGDNIVLVMREIYRTSLEGKDLIGEIWSIENLRPMGWERVLYEKGHEIFDRVRGATVGKEQYVQP